MKRVFSSQETPQQLAFKGGPQLHWCLYHMGVSGSSITQSQSQQNCKGRAKLRDQEEQTQLEEKFGQRLRRRFFWRFPFDSDLL